MYKDSFNCINYIEYMIIIQQLSNIMNRRGTIDSIQIKEITPKDLKQAKEFTVEDMNLSRYVSSQLESRYVL